MFVSKHFTSTISVLFHLCSVSLQLPHIHALTYETRSDVRDDALIDLDQRDIEKELTKHNSAGRAGALSIYGDGSHSKPYAYLHLENRLDEDVDEGSSVFGLSFNGDEISAKIMKDARKGDLSLQVQYVGSIDLFFSQVTCKVGGAVEPILDGCFVADGYITIDSLNIKYSYDPHKDNKNDFTIKGLSTEHNMLKCSDCPYIDFQKFYNYYGYTNYANHWLHAAFARDVVTLSNHGPIDFGTYSEEGIAALIQTSIVFMNIWMHVVGEMERALDACVDNCDSEQCTEKSVKFWDAAVAVYTGSSLEQGNSTGYLLYAKTNNLCSIFGTCVGKHNVARANLDIFEEFKNGQINLLHGHCGIARWNKVRIVQLMTVALIQGALTNAYVDLFPIEEKRGEGAAFVASVLPLVHWCNPKDAAIINKNIGPGTVVGNFSEVKAAFERNYECMGITCSDVGGLVNPGGFANVFNSQYLPEASPCRANKSSSFDVGLFQLLISTVVSLLFLSAFLVFMVNTIWRKKAYAIDCPGRDEVAA